MPPAAAASAWRVESVTTMDETSALEITAIRAVETRDRARRLWTDADRSWASRAAAEVVGEEADATTFVARRARLALERIGKTHHSVPRAVHALRWRPWVAWLIVAGAFVAGIVIDRFGGAQRVNLLAPPVFALLLWNLGVYVTLAVGSVLRLGTDRGAGPLRSLLVRVAGRTGRPAGKVHAATDEGDGSISACVAAIPRDWARLASRLYAARSARILHLAAALLALGTIAGLYTRGLAFEYRASWESTFLDAGQVRSLLAVALAPGAWVTGRPIPDATEIEALRSPGSANAAVWLHLMAASVLVVVVVPRLALAALVRVVERHRARHLPVALDEPYFQRLLRGYRGGPVRLTIVPYSYTLPPAAIAGLEAIVARVFGGSAALTVEAPVAYGEEDAFARRPALVHQGPLIGVFSLTATPEPEAHGTFLTALAARRDPAWPLLAILDESAFRSRWGSDAPRLAERRVLWRDFLAEQRVTPVATDLADPDLAAVEAMIDAALRAPPAARERG